MKGHAGKLLRVDLTSMQVDTIPTEQYEKWYGGIGMGTALFWDEVDKDYITDTHDKSGFEPENVLCIMPGLLSGTLAPNGGRLEICGISPISYPRPQFSRGNAGGRFAPYLKFAGYDGIVVKGRADNPVWVDIRDDDVQIRDASHLWGLGAFATQEEIWRDANIGVGGWSEVGTGRNSGRTTQRPAVLTTGQAGENQARIACLVHDSGNAVGMPGFGGVFGSKNLKAISVIGTGSVEVAHPDQMLEARAWLTKYNYDVQNPQAKQVASFGVGWGPGQACTYVYRGFDKLNFGRPLGCYNCPIACRENFTTNLMPGGETQCVEAGFWAGADARYHGESTHVQHKATQMLDDYSINAYEISDSWIKSLYDRGLMGPGLQIETDLDWEQYGSEAFLDEFLRQVAYREGIGDDIAEGHLRAAERWGVLEEDLMSGTLPDIYWAGNVHHGHVVAWAYQSLFGVRDINQHGLDGLLDLDEPDITRYTAEQAAKRLAELGAPWHDEMMANCSEEGIYSLGTARAVAWERRFCKFWKNSLSFCDWFTPSWFNYANPDIKGISPEMEERFLSAATGEDLSWEEGLEIGRRVWNLERAILVMHGRHRDEEYFPPFPPYTSWVHIDEPPYLQNRDPESTSHRYPVYEDGEWKWHNACVVIDKDKMDEFKTIYFDLEGWDTATGWPTRETLEGCGLEQVADELAARDRLG